MILVRNWVRYFLPSRNERFAWLIIAGEKYRIGHAKTSDGKQWQLSLDDTGIAVSEEDWDSEMIEYPFVFDHVEQRNMLYNGNGYGKSGFGLATLMNE